MDTLPTSSGFSRWLLISILAGMCVLTYTLIVIYGVQFFSGKEKPKAPSSSLASTNSAISGNIDLNGLPPKGSIIVIAVKKNGEPFHTVIENIAPLDGAVWSWNDAKPNTEYIIEAYLQQNGKTLAKSKKLVLIAPGDSETLRIDIPTVSQPIDTQSIKSAISGTFNINGYIPTGSTVSIAVRKVGDTNFTNIATDLPAVDNSSWSWIQASQNVMYEMQATLSNGTAITKSQVISATAPATNELITINSTAATPTSVTTAISGMINLNGSVSSNSYITIGVRPSGTTQFTQVETDIPAIDGMTWTYLEAKAGTTYDVQAYLWQNNSLFSQSQILAVAAPATGELLTINATTHPSVPLATPVASSTPHLTPSNTPTPPSKTTSTATPSPATSTKSITQ